MKQFHLILDPGHGGSDSGATSEYGRESTINLTVAKKVHALLTCEHMVTLTRRHDVFESLQDRYQITKLLNPDAFVSIHCNAGPDGATGTETLYRTDTDVPLAKAVQASVVEQIRLRDRGVRSDVDYLHKKLMVLSNLEVPSCLVELGFITTKKDMDAVADTDAVAFAVARGIRRWWAKVCEEEGT